jgi:tripartite ATP-independent transporter DctM subunit
MAGPFTASSRLDPLKESRRGSALALGLRAAADLPEIVASGLLLAVTMLLFLQTVCRYIFFVPIGWAEEGARFALIWLTFIGAAVCSRKGLHSRFTVLFDRSTGRARRAMGAVTDMVVLVFAGIMIVKGWDMVERTQYERWIMLDLPMSWSYLAIPVGGLLILGFTLHRGVRAWPGRLGGEGGFVPVAVMVAVAIVYALIGTPIAFMLGASVTTGLLADGRTDLILIPTKMLEGVDSFVLLAIPLFIFAGSLMDLGGISLRIMRFARALVGHFHGGLPMTAVVSEMLFSGISGSTMADASAIASMDIPAMKQAGYKPEYAVSVVAASSAMGVLIPPCIIMVVLGALMNVSVAALFVGGFLPALVLALALFVLIGYQARKYNFPKEDRRLSLREIARTGLQSGLALGMFLLIFGGILGGAMTPTEAGAVAVVYAFIVTVLIYREISLRGLGTIVVDAAAQSAMVLFILSVANIFSFLLSTQRVPQATLELLAGLSASPWVFLTVSMALFIVLASVIEPLPVMIVFVPIFLPAIDTLGISRLHYGVLMTAATGLGMFVPPVGIGLILVCAIAKVKMTDVLRYLLPFLGVLCAGLLILIMFPTVTTILPRLLLPNIKP